MGKTKNAGDELEGLAKAVASSTKGSKPWESKEPEETPAPEDIPTFVIRERISVRHGSTGFVRGQEGALIKALGDRAAKAVASLAKRGFIEKIDD